MNKLPFLRGVNLGGWLLLEKWMTPTLFEGTDAIDEYTLSKTKGGIEKIQHHRRTFIRDEDFLWLKKAGLNTIRIPIGYWILDGDKPFIGGIERLDWAIDKAKKHKLFVIVDLHGAPGSQNGRDHSGRVGRALWYQNSENRKRTIEILVRLADRYRNQENVIGLEMLNEPKAALFNFKLRKFYKDAYEEIIKVSRPGLNIVFHDSFTPRLLSDALGSSLHPDFPVILDNHWYQGLWYQGITDFLIKVVKVKGYFRFLEKRRKLYQRLEKKQPVIIGEWSIVMSSKMLEGLNPKDQIKIMSKHGRIQMRVYESSTSGWFYWSYKTEAPGIWNFRSQVEGGIIKIKGV